MERFHFGTQEDIMKMNKEHKMKSFNVVSTSEDPVARTLSNFAFTPFELDGREYNSVESFWQSLYFPENSEERELVAVMDGKFAKKAGLERPESKTVEYQGEKIKIGSEEHQGLMRRAIEAKFEQNPRAMDALKSTAGKRLTHVTKSPDSKSIPGYVFTKILTEVRDGRD